MNGPPFILLTAMTGLDKAGRETSESADWLLDVVFKIRSAKPTWHLATSKWASSKRIVVYKGAPFRFHVGLQKCGVYCSVLAERAGVEQGLLFWLFQGGFKISSGTIHWYTSSYGIVLALMILKYRAYILNITTKHARYMLIFRIYSTAQSLK